MTRSPFIATVVAFFAFYGSVFAQDNDAKSDQSVIVVVGAAGTEEYGKQFSAWAELWSEAASHTQLKIIGANSEKDSKSNLKESIESAIESSQLQELWVVFIGHGTYDGKRAKFNLHGPDIDASEMKSWLIPAKQRIVILNCSASSSPFIIELSGKNRIVVTATRDGYESNFARFGQFLAQAINDPAIDLDKDGQTSVLEAFCAASRSSTDFYLQENRIATEHALLDDNGDQKGTPATWFEGVRVSKNPKKGTADGLLANQVFLQRRGIENFLDEAKRKQRDQLEAKLESLRRTKSKLDKSEYLQKIEPILVQLAELYESADTKN